MKLIGLFDSPYVRRVAVSMRLLGFDFEHVALSVFRNQDEMRQINPLVKVPMLVLDSGEKTEIGVKEGDLVLMTSFGGGVTWGGVLLRW